jgi:Bifunctional DNA primase/polymerase, N-terminal
MPQIFASWQAAYAERHIPTFPIDAAADNGSRKLPIVTHYQKMGLPASRQLVLKGLDASGIACMAGARNRLTIIDIDAQGAEADRLMAEAQRMYGRSRFIVRSGRGGLHAYYRHNGEGRKIRPDPARKIDILGGGVVVLPPSRGASRLYEIIEGTLDDLPTLTKISNSPPVRPDIPGVDPDRLRDVYEGERDKKFWPYVARMAHQARGVDELIEIAAELNDMFPMPLTHAEIAAKCKYWIDKTERGENRFGFGRFVTTDHTVIDNLMMRDPDAFLLLMFLRRTHWGRDFTLANDTRALMPGGGWRRERFAAARSRLIEGHFLIVVSPATRHRPMTCRVEKFQRRESIRARG